MKKLFAIVYLSLFTCTTFAQYVTIPDTAFASWIRNNGLGSCMNGNELDTTCPAVLNLASVSCNFLPIRDLTGIQYFKNLTTLNCVNDSLTFLPILPSALKVLVCSNNRLSALSRLPSSIRNLACDNNPISTISVFPESMANFDCSNDSLLTGLPALPLMLLTLNCNYDNLDSLPSLPNNLSSISCISNRLTKLPVLPSSLISLNCNINHIATLPGVLPEEMLLLWCANNDLTAIPVLPDSLRLLSCGYNSISELPNIPSTVTVLECSYNSLRELPELPDSLDKLYFSHNLNITCLSPLKRIVDLEFDSVGVSCLPNYGNVTSSIPALDSFPICIAGNMNGCAIYTNINGPVISGLIVYPNPANNKLHISYPLQNATFKVSDMTGREWPVLLTGNEVDISALSPGLYCLSVESAESYAVVRFVKE